MQDGVIDGVVGGRERFSNTRTAKSLPSNRLKDVDPDEILSTAICVEW
jgi:hypothetical protein